MPSFFDKLRGWLSQIVELGLLLIALGIVLQILFGRAVSFIPGDVVGNLIGVVKAMGDNGLVGLIAIGVILWLFWKRQPG
ncbi:MAG: hypothetical protein IH878_16115 [Gemmatimonadetes bacterium]|jgi:hypothetical protein|nr:hypothetical protein [Pseudomonadota bacterium]MCH7778035.1 hypothetical protein [Gemmatimonadota bacterium]